MFFLIRDHAATESFTLLPSLRVLITCQSHFLIYVNQMRNGRIDNECFMYSSSPRSPVDFSVLWSVTQLRATSFFNSTSLYMPMHIQGVGLFFWWMQVLCVHAFPSENIVFCCNLQINHVPPAILEVVIFTGRVRCPPSHRLMARKL